MVDYIPQTLLRLLALYSSILLLTGLVASYGCKRHSARAHQILVLFMLAALIIPGLHLLVKNLRWGLLPAQPLQARAFVSEPTIVETAEVHGPIAMPALPSAPLTNHTVSPAMNKTTSINWSLYLSGVWLLASALLLGRTILAYIRTARLISQSVPLPSPALQTSLQRACTRFQLQRGIDLHSHPDIQTPSIWCWSKPPVLLAPASLTADQCWEGVLCHELAHYQRHDHLSTLLAELALCILPWNPLVWMARQRLTFLSEQACDDWVLACDSDGTRYAESLLDMLPATRLTTTLSVATSKKGVAQRVRRILQDQTGNPRLNRYWIFGTSLGITLLIATLCLAQVRPSTENQNATTQTENPQVQDSKPSPLTIQVLDTDDQPVSNAVVTDNVTFQPFQTNELGQIQWSLSPTPRPMFFSAVDQTRGLYGYGSPGSFPGEEKITIHVKPTILAGIIAQGPQKQRLDHVRIFSVGGNPATINSTQSDQEGRFIVPIPTQTDKHGISLIALSPQQRLATMARIDPESPPASIQLKPGCSVRARLVDPNNQPVTGTEVIEFASFLTDFQDGITAVLGIGLTVDDQGQLSIPVLPHMKEFRLLGLTESHLKLQIILQEKDLQTPSLDLGTIVMKSY